MLRAHNELTDEVKSVTADASQSEMGFLLNPLLCNYTEPIRLLVRNDSQQGRRAGKEVWMVFTFMASSPDLLSLNQFQSS